MNPVEQVQAAINGTGPSLAQQTSQTIGMLAPHATTYLNSQFNGTPNQQFIPKALQPTAPQGINALFDFAGGVIKWIGDFGYGVGKTAVDSAVNIVESPYRMGSAIANMQTAAQDTTISSANVGKIDQMQQSLTQQFKSGQITKDAYSKGLQSISKLYQTQGKIDAQTTAQTNHATQEFTQGAQDAAMATVAVITAGMAIPLEAAVTSKIFASSLKIFDNPQVENFLINGAKAIDNITGFGAKAVSKVTGSENAFTVSTMQQIVDQAGVRASTDLTTQQIAKNIAVNMLLKKPLIYQASIDNGYKIYKDIATGKYPDALVNMALMASMALKGGPLGFALDMLGKGGEWLKNVSFNSAATARAMTELDAAATAGMSRKAFWDVVSTQVGDKTASQFYDYAKQELQKGNSTPYRIGQVMEQVNMKIANGNAVVAANHMIDWWKSLDGGASLAKMSIKDLVDNSQRWVDTREAIVNAAKQGLIKGVDPKDAERIVVGRAGASELGYVAKVLGEVAKGNEAASPTYVISKLLDAWQNLKDSNPTAAWANSETLDHQIVSAIGHGPGTAERNMTGEQYINAVTKAIQSIKAGGELPGLSAELRAQAAKDGYIAILPQKTITPYISKDSVTGKISSMFAEGGNNDPFLKAVKPIPVLSATSGFLARIGLSPESSQGAVMKSFISNFGDLLPAGVFEGNGMSNGEKAQAIMQKLSAYSREPHTGSLYDHAPITDYRQMTIKDIQSALGYSADKAKQVAQALNTAMLHVPLEVRGLGDKIMDVNYKFNPLAAKYARIQGAARFTFNPFFRLQQTAQTEFLSQLEAGGKPVAAPLWSGMLSSLGFGKNVDSAVQVLTDNHIFSGGYSGETADNTFSALGSHILKTEKRSLAGLTMVMANKVGMDVPTFVKEYQPQVADALRTIMQYSNKNNFVNSPMARTLNFAFFPFRYNMKVASLMAQQISRWSPPAQVALITGFMQFNDFLKSDQGIAWQSQHGQAIEFMKYISPLYPLSYIQGAVQGVASGSPHVGDFGLLGGLPFGAISTFLDGMGIIQMNQPFIDPKSGSVLPKYVPVTAMGDINLAIQDLIGAVFTYPGATLGLPSKGKLLRGAASFFTPGVTTTSGDLKKVDEQNQLTPDQLHQQQVLQQQTGSLSTSQQTAQNGQTVNVWQGPGIYQVPDTAPTPAPKYKTTSSSGRLKKSQIRPTAL